MCIWPFFFLRYSCLSGPYHLKSVSRKITFPLPGVFSEMCRQIADIHVCPWHINFQLGWNAGMVTRRTCPAVLLSCASHAEPCIKPRFVALKTVHSLFFYIYFFFFLLRIPHCLSRLAPTLSCKVMNLFGEIIWFSSVGTTVGAALPEDWWRGPCLLRPLRTRPCFLGRQSLHRSVCGFFSLTSAPQSPVQMAVSFCLDWQLTWHGLYVDFFFDEHIALPFPIFLIKLLWGEKEKNLKFVEDLLHVQLHVQVLLDA